VIPSELAHELRYIELRTARRIRTLRPGPYTSRVRGDGFDLDQHRPYRPGDDVRLIDWNVTARTGHVFVRQTYAERELDLVVASLLFSAAADRISTGFLAFAGQVLRWVPPTAHPRRAWATLSELCAIEAPPGPTALLPTLEHLLRSLKRLTLVVIISDFLVSEQLEETLELGTLAARHDVVAVILADALEGRLPEGSGFVQVRDLESGTERAIRLNPAVRAQYAASVERWRNDLTRRCYRVGIEPVFVDAAEDVVVPLARIFESRR
jgi:uncharacterized protein (DUF58 family)